MPCITRTNFVTPFVCIDVSTLWCDSLMWPKPSIYITTQLVTILEWIKPWSWPLSLLWQILNFNKNFHPIYHQIIYVNIYCNKLGTGYDWLRDRLYCLIWQQIIGLIFKDEYNANRQTLNTISVDISDLVVNWLGKPVVVFVEI